MKEYLLEHNGKYELHKGGIVPDGAIEVPEGAVFYAEDGNLGIRKNYFFRLRSDSFCDEAVWLDNQWMRAKFNVSRMDVLWQRFTQPEELPFVDDGPQTINNQCEKMENLKIKVNNEAESKEAQELFFKLGYKAGACSLGFYPATIVTTIAWGDGDWVSTRALKNDHPAHAEHKEITLPELRKLAGHESLNDRYAEIEKVRHAHYFKDVSDIDEIDVYEVLHRFGVTDPCLQHIVKKALCAGERGHKDFHTDLKNIADTAQRMLEIHGL